LRPVECRGDDAVVAAVKRLCHAAAVWGAAEPLVRHLLDVLHDWGRAGARSPEWSGPERWGTGGREVMSSTERRITCFSTTCVSRLITIQELIVSHHSPPIELLLPCPGQGGGGIQPTPPRGADRWRMHHACVFLLNHFLLYATADPTRSSDRGDLLSSYQAGGKPSNVLRQRPPRAHGGGVPPLPRRARGIPL